MRKLYHIQGDYGFYDSVDVETEQVAKAYLCLDQAMILITINNYLNNDVIKKRFHNSPIIKRVEKLLDEDFFLSK